MLSSRLRSSRRPDYHVVKAIIGRQWQTYQVHTARNWAPFKKPKSEPQKPSLADSKPMVLPGSASNATSEPLPQGRVATTPSSTVARTLATPIDGTTIRPDNIPLESMSPPPSSASGTANTVPPPPASTTQPPPPPPPKPRRFFRRSFLTLLLLTGLGYSGGVYYSRVNDNFHDFFTEYVPFGENAVLYLEEAEFRKRYHSPSSRGSHPRDTGDRIKIPSRSGVSWRVAEDKNEARHSSTVKGNKTVPGEAAHSPVHVTPKDRIKAVEKAKSDAKDLNRETGPPPDEAPEHMQAPKPAPEETSVPPAVQPLAKPVESASASFKVPEVDEPSRMPPKIERVDQINIEDAQEPVVQDLVRVINDIITLVNADNANAKYSTTIQKAKNELSKVGKKIKALRHSANQDADTKIKAAHEEFDRGARALVERIQEEMSAQESSFKQEYEMERQKIQDHYGQKLKVEIEQAKKVHEERTKNELLEQAIEMKRKFADEVKSRVEEERSGRLGKLSELTNTVTELEKLTTDWNSVVDVNLQTQHLHVAVEAVRASLEHTDSPRPFVRELAALKEIASNDAVVTAAIASVNPTAYQRGVPSSAQLIDRFRRVASEVRKASLLPEEAGVASHASSFILSRLLFRKKGVANGDDVESILTRTETYLEEGDLDGAAREMNGLKGWAKTLSRDWLCEVRKVLEVQQALDVIATEARLQSLRVE